MTAAQLTAVGVVRAALIGAAGAVLAAGMAAAASPLFPVGLPPRPSHIPVSGPTGPR